MFDLEMEQKSTRKEELPRRVRFYHSLLDAEILKSGAAYDSLKRAIVLVITTFDLKFISFAVIFLQIFELVEN